MYTQVIAARLTEEDRRKIIEHTTKRGITPNEYVRSLIYQDFQRWNEGTSVNTAGRTSVNPRASGEDDLKLLKTRSGRIKCPKCAKTYKTEEGFYKHYGEKH